MLEIKILERAQDDIFNIIEHGTAAHGEVTARDYVNKIGARINWLGSNPQFGPLHSELRGGIRSFRQGQHRIYYVASANTITIARILHLSMDVKHHFE